MSRNRNQVWIHLIWSVKYRHPSIDSRTMSAMGEFITEHFKDSTNKIICANGHRDHLHVLLIPDLNVAISKTAKDIKGATSHWLSKECLVSSLFKWQRGYAAYSVSPQDVERITKYISSQQKHHGHKG